MQDVPINTVRDIHFSFVLHLHGINGRGMVLEKNRLHTCKTCF